MSDAATLFKEALQLTRQAATEASQRDETRGDELRAARERLTERVLEGFEERVRDAARRGLSEADLYAFDGTELVDGFFTLYLLKGPDTPSTVLKTLQQRLSPFRVRHHWVEGTLHNRVIVSWEPLSSHASWRMKKNVNPV